jgi:hypothetical protein
MTDLALKLLYYSVLFSLHSHGGFSLWICALGCGLASVDGVRAWISIPRSSGVARSLSMHLVTLVQLVSRLQLGCLRSPLHKWVSLQGPGAFPSLLGKGSVFSEVMSDLPWQRRGAGFHGCQNSITVFSRHPEDSIDDGVEEPPATCHPLPYSRSLQLAVPVAAVILRCHCL